METKVLIEYFLVSVVTLTASRAVLTLATAALARESV